MWIKICANTTLDDAQLAAQLGADAVGFVFAPSARRVTPAEVAQITPHLPAHIERVGVFPSLAADEIAHIAQQASLTAVQLHGGVCHTLVRQLHQIFKGKIGLIQTLHWDINSGETSAGAIAAQLNEIAADGIVDRVLIDSKVGAANGGTGISFDWHTARAVLSQADPGLRIIVAGGLRPQNVVQAIQGLDPWGVDVASGVESMPGRKSPEKLAAFVQKAREAKIGFS